MLDHIVTLDVPFETETQAEIAMKTMSVDPILKKNEITVDYSIQNNLLTCKFAGISDRVIRVAVSSAIDNIKTIIECMEEFDGKEKTIFTNDE
ncbi:EKC/KEOPS complex subunit [Candidozyma auris]|nr:hypothetical protein QG37_03499 [[Candida] auris]PIS48690.1 hypothetical protein B9J08_005392 [[Candida] auris]PIS49302.1 hypothetical protein CJI97_005475 [[Candida] auris]PSK76800.1 hypothetical protein CJJ07_003368 [[Candida] auris]QEL61807.1 hypothetical protein CJJ09_003963 [[Candida] auris]